MRAVQPFSCSNENTKNNRRRKREGMARVGHDICSSGADEETMRRDWGEHHLRLNEQTFLCLFVCNKNIIYNIHEEK